jgi:hypothetical protein
MTIEEIELHCVDHGTELPREHPTRRRYFIELDFVVGASKGEETRYVYAEWHSNGAVHGRPITPVELQKKGLSRGTD